MMTTASSAYPFSDAEGADEGMGGGAEKRTRDEDIQVKRGLSGSLISHLEL